MSSTTNVQNFLVNVFRPVYTYDATTTLFTPKLEMSNIDTYSGNSISIFTAAIGDSNSNVYVGSNAGNPYTTTKLCRNVTAVGYGAGSNISNVSNATYVGYYAGAGALSASNTTAIGANANGNGISNVYVGNTTGGAGNSNVFLGAGITGSGSNNILIGPGISNGSSNDIFRVGTGYLNGNMNTRWLGLGTTSPYDSNNKLDVSGNTYILGQLAINRVAVRTLDVNGNLRASDSNGTLDFNLGVTSSTGGFASVQSNISAGVGSTTIGTLKRGIVCVSAVDQGSSANRASYIYFAYTTSNVTSLASSVNGDTNITTSTSNIQISNATTTKTYDYSITYFPLP